MLVERKRCGMHRPTCSLKLTLFHFICIHVQISLNRDKPKCQVVAKFESQVSNRTVNNDHRTVEEVLDQKSVIWISAGYTRGPETLPVALRDYIEK